jgi:hypothetical protein
VQNECSDVNTSEGQEEKRETTRTAGAAVTRAAGVDRHAMNKIVGIAVAEYNMQGGTRIITGHGRIYNATDAVEFGDTNTIVRDRVVAMARKGATLEQVRAAKVTLEYDAQYGRYPNWTSDMFVEAIYKETVKANSPASTNGRKAPAAAKKG